MALVLLAFADLRFTVSVCGRIYSGLYIHTMRITLLFFLLITHCLVQADTLTGRVVRVTDGGTVVILDAGNVQHKIRLTGIDAPERGQAYGTKSKEYLSGSVAGKFVVVEYDKRDRYERILGKVLLSDQDMNLEQIKAGLAWHYKKYQNEQTTADRVKYSDAERAARMEKRGLWHDANPVPPWEYRQAKRQQRKDMEPFIHKSESRSSPY
jgi:endonuclease YncB( thermonuclease family)